MIRQAIYIAQITGIAAVALAIWLIDEWRDPRC
jgi:hypothetical protein